MYEKTVWNQGDIILERRWENIETNINIQTMYYIPSETIHVDR